ncbi:hypothetical protein DFH09DRAFT_1073054 [Mycena vulgaris]|nr:hypothetical protein DFH09DRAFT_1073054 [Mycena vulgaris]
MPDSGDGMCSAFVWASVQFGLGRSGCELHPFLTLISGGGMQDLWRNTLCSPGGVERWLPVGQKQGTLARTKGGTTGAGLQGRQGDWGERIGEYGRNKEWRLGSAGLTYARSLPTMESSRWVREGARASQDERKDRSAFAKDGDERRAYGVQPHKVNFRWSGQPFEDILALDNKYAEDNPPAKVDWILSSEQLFFTKRKMKRAAHETTLANLKYSADSLDYELAFLARCAKTLNTWDSGMLVGGVGGSVEIKAEQKSTFTWQEKMVDTWVHVI